MTRTAAARRQLTGIQVAGVTAAAWARSAGAASAVGHHDGLPGPGRAAAAASHGSHAAGTAAERHERTRATVTITVADTVAAPCRRPLAGLPLAGSSSSLTVRLTVSLWPGT